VIVSQTRESDTGALVYFLLCNFSSYYQSLNEMVARLLLPVGVEKLTHQKMNEKEKSIIIGFRCSLSACPKTCLPECPSPQTDDFAAGYALLSQLRRNIAPTSEHFN
jgi:hypothetical protein